MEDGEAALATLETMNPEPRFSILASDPVIRGIRG